MSEPRRRAVRTFLQAFVAIAASAVPLVAAFDVPAATVGKIGAGIGVATAAASWAMNWLEERAGTTLL